MKKTYWWRIILIIATFVILTILYFVSCDGRLSRCFWGNNVIARTTFHFFSVFFLVSPFLFFVMDRVFLKWFRFAIVWIVLSVILIMLTPEKYAFFVMDPDKETVSIWMASLFVILSFAKIIWDWAKDRKKSAVQ